MATKIHPDRRPDRPWYCSDRQIEEYKQVGQNGGDLTMIRSLKILRTIIVNIGFIVISVYSLSLGAEPTYVALTSLTVLGAYNGLEYSDYAALVQAIIEMSAQPSETSTDDGDDNGGS